MLDCALAEKALSPTIRWAAGKAFFKHFWASIPTPSIQSTNDLDRLPVLQRVHLSNYFDVTAAVEPPDRVVHTTGTTGRLTMRGRSNAELAAYSTFMRELMGDPRQRLGRPDDGSKAPLALVICAANHGDTAAGVLPFQLVTVGYNSDVIQQCVQLLQRRYAFRGYSERIQLMSCDFFMLKSLTAALLAVKINPSSLGMRMIAVTGNYVQPRDIDVFGALWNAEIADRYSCAECIGGATHCWKCGCYSFDPMLVVEILDPWTQRRRWDGAGLLTLTELYPFSLYQPMIRYQNGDLFEWVDAHCSCRVGRGVRYVGRFAHTPVFDCRIIVYPADIERALAPFPELRRIPMAGMSANRYGCDLGVLAGDVEIVGLDQGRVRLTLACEIKFVPQFFPEAAESLRRRLAEVLLKESPLLASQVSAGTAELRIDLTAAETSRRLLPE
jgi:phenylacetate-coenzyme A ligase PaaK-like adenylate-forming protein